MKKYWNNTHPEKNTRRLLKMRDIREKECYAIIIYDIMSARKKIRCWVVHLDLKRKQFVIRTNNNYFINYFINLFITGVLEKKTPVTISLITSHISFTIFVVTYNTCILPAIDRMNLVFNFQEIRKVKMKDEQDLIRRHLDNTSDEG